MYKSFQKIIRIFQTFNSVDFFSLYELYAPIIGDKAINFYIALINKKYALDVLKVQNIDMNIFLDEIHYTEAIYLENKNKLESIGLLETRYKKNAIGTIDYYLVLKPTLDLVSFFKNNIFLNLLVKNLSEKKLEQLKEIIKINQEFINDSFENITKELEDTFITYENPVDYDLQNQFYKIIYDSLLKPFNVLPKVWEIFNNYCVTEKLLTIEELALDAFSSIKKNDNSYTIDANEFDLKVQARVNSKNKILVNFNSLIFWQKLIFISPEKAKDECLNYYKSKPLNVFYLDLTNKNPPVTIIKFFNNTAKKNVSFVVINCLMDFTKIWIKNLNVKYLNMLFDTLIEKELYDLVSVLGHLKEVILNDYEKNGENNKLKIKPINENINNSFVCKEILNKHNYLEINENKKISENKDNKDDFSDIDFDYFENLD